MRANCKRNSYLAEDEKHDLFHTCRPAAEISGPADGVFDYIVCHGVYSWIPQFVRDALMRVVAERLSPEGIAVISFNVLPGWRMFQVVRDSMILHAGHIESHEQRSAQTRLLFEQMAKHAAADSSYGGIWKREAKRMSDLPDFYLAHELFEENNTPLSFQDFMRAASRGRCSQI